MLAQPSDSAGAAWLAGYNCCACCVDPTDSDMAFPESVWHFKCNHEDSVELFGYNCDSGVCIATSRSFDFKVR